VRAATADDAEALARGVVEGVAGYAEFAPPGWRGLSLAAEVAHARERLRDPAATCLVAESGGELVGQITLLAAAHAPRPVDEPGLGHISNLFVRADHRGAGVARELHAAALALAEQRGFTALRLFVAAGAGRARRFYAREGWEPAAGPFDEPVIGLAMIEYRRALQASAR
jgi:GNAT superfamily N-acetyltransferase